MIEVNQIAKSFARKGDGKRARVDAVENVSFVADDGRITAMLGPNGAGKTTTLPSSDAGAPTADRCAWARSTCSPIRAPCARSSECCPTRAGVHAPDCARNIEYYATCASTVQIGNERLAMMAELLDMGSLLARRVKAFPRRAVKVALRGR